MVAHQAIGIDFIFPFLMLFCQNGYQFFIILISRKDIPLFNASYHDVIDLAITFYSCHSWHVSFPY